MPFQLESVDYNFYFDLVPILNLLTTFSGFKYLLMSLWASSV